MSIETNHQPTPKRRGNWIVAVATDQAHPRIFGPYTEARAEQLAEQFNTRVDPDGYGYINASARPIPNLGIRAMLAEFMAVDRVGQ